VWLSPRRIAVVTANASAAPHAGAKPVTALGDFRKAIGYRELPTGVNRKVIAATSAAAHCAAIGCVSRRGGCCCYGRRKLTAQGNAPLPQQSP
jgi:hypothetical protein